MIWYIDWPTPTSAAWWTMASTPSKRLAQRAGVAHVAAHELGVGGDVARAEPAMHLLDEPVVHAHVVARREQRLGDMRSDETGSAGDEHTRHASRAPLEDMSELGRASSCTGETALPEGTLPLRIDPVRTPPAQPIVTAQSFPVKPRW